MKVQEWLQNKASSNNIYPAVCNYLSNIFIKPGPNDIDWGKICEQQNKQSDNKRLKIDQQVHKATSLLYAREKNLRVFFTANTSTWEPVLT